ncbi:MAG: flavodoxin family protein [Methanomicrobiales archaeon]|nr:flavodoxin family protein [Methanomicrobiales archaeon]
MERPVALLRRVDHEREGFALSLWREDWTDVYPGLFRYSIILTSKGRERVLFRTNTYEYAPTVPLGAEEVATRRLEDVERHLHSFPDSILEEEGDGMATGEPDITVDVLVIQGSPRPGGNCCILSEWAEEMARSLGKSVKVLFPADMTIRPCIGCYQCYNFGRCTFEDDMADVIGYLKSCRLLVVCSPVYTNTVPGGLKHLIDRCQAYHASRLLEGGPSGQKGIIISVAGRTGDEHFRCVVGVLKAFMMNLGIETLPSLLFGGMDRTRDISKQEGVRMQVEEAVMGAFSVHED